MKLPKSWIKVTFLPKILAILLLVLLFFIGYQYLLKHPTFIQQLDDVLSSSTNYWKTYTNEKYGYGFKYPRHWKLTEYSDSSIVSISRLTIQPIYGDFSNNEFTYSNVVSFYYYNSVTDEPENSMNHLGATNLEEMVDKNSLVERIGQIDLGGIPAIDAILYGHGSYYTVFATKNTHLYEIIFDNTSSKEKLTPIHKAILSTFTFIK